MRFRRYPLEGSQNLMKPIFQSLRVSVDKINFRNESIRFFMFNSHRSIKLYMFLWLFYMLSTVSLNLPL